MTYFVVFLVVLIIYEIYDIVKNKEDKKYFIVLFIILVFTLTIGIFYYNDRFERGLSYYILKFMESRGLLNE